MCRLIIQTYKRLPFTVVLHHTSLEMLLPAPDDLYATLAWSRWAYGIPPSMAALSAVTWPAQPSPQLPQVCMPRTSIHQPWC